MSHEHLPPDSVDVSDLKRELEEMMTRVTEAGGHEEFPIGVFPDDLQHVIRHCQETMGFPIEYTAVSMLFAASVALGGSVKVRVKGIWLESAVLYVALVGAPGTTKTHPLRFALGPIVDRDADYHDMYLKDLAEYEAAIAATRRSKDKTGTPLVPVEKKHLLSDFTLEALNYHHVGNPKGLGVWVDELMGWLHNMNRYNNGDDAVWWNMNWSGAPIINVRKTQSIMIRSPFVSVAGTIQPGVLHRFAADRVANGFMDRMLFAYPANQRKQYWNELQISKAIVDAWKRCLDRLLDIGAGEHAAPPPVIEFTREAYGIIMEWQREKADACNAENDDVLASVVSKMESYVCRFALLLEMLQLSCERSEGVEVTAASASGAVKLADYFLQSALKVRGAITKSGDNKALGVQKAALLEILPEEFSYAEGLQIAKKVKMPDRTFQRFLSNEASIEKTGHGQYKKRAREE